MRIDWDLACNLVAGGFWAFFVIELIAHGVRYKDITRDEKRQKRLGIYIPDDDDQEAA